MSGRSISIGTLATTTESDLYVVPAHFNADIKTITLSNNNGAGQHITVKWVNAATGITYVLVDDKQMAASEVLQLFDPLFLSAGDKIRVVADSSIHIRVSLRVEEIYSSVVKN